MRVPCLALVCLSGIAVAWVEPVRYTLDPDHSFVHFEVLHFGTSTTRGRFGPVTGEVMLDRQRRSGSLAVTVATPGP